MSESVTPVQTERVGPAANEFLAGIGHNALGGLEGFTDRQQQVLLLASLGGTTEEVAGLLACAEDEITETRDELIEIFDAKNMAMAVNLAILGGYLPIEVKKNPNLHLRSRDKQLLDGFRQGLTNVEIGKEMGKSKNAIRKYSQALFEKIDSSGRTHSVRRAYELGIFEIPAAQN